MIGSAEENVEGPVEDTVLACRAHRRSSRMGQNGKRRSESSSIRPRAQESSDGCPGSAVLSYGHGSSCLSWSLHEEVGAGQRQCGLSDRLMPRTRFARPTRLASVLCFLLALLRLFL